MSCSSYDSTINITRTNQNCDADCMYSYKYNTNSSCILNNRGGYLEIQTDGPDDVKLNGLAMSVLQTRLYRPSIHMFNGSRAAAELIIQHGGAGQNLLVCIPIQINTGAGPSNKFFTQIIPYVPSTNDEPQTVNVSKWSLNQVLNYNVPYYYYLGPFPYEPCNGQQSTIVFDLQHSAKINQSDFDLLEGQISQTPSPQSKIRQNSTEMLIYNSAGTKNPTDDGSSDYDIVECVPLTGMDDKDSKKKGSMFGKLSSPTGGTAIFAYFIIGLIVIYFLVYVIFPAFVHKFTGVMKNVTSSTT
jgi:carbonic anhydrase